MLRHFHMRRTLALLSVTFVAAGSAAPGSESTSGADAQNSALPSDMSPRPGIDVRHHREVLRAVWGKYHETIGGFDLTNAQRTRLMDLLIARQEADFDVHQVSIKLGATSDNEISKATLESRRSFDSEIKELTGEAGVQALHRAELVANLKINLHGSVAADLAVEGVPLTPGQETALTQIYADAYEQSRAASGSASETPVEPSSALSDMNLRILGHASQVISPRQITVLRDSMIATQEQDRFQEALFSKTIGASLYLPGSTGPAAKDPEEVLMRHRAKIRSVWKSDNEIITGMDLTPENAATVLKLLVARDEAISDAREEDLNRGITNGQDMNRSEVEAGLAVTAEIRAVIGDEGVRTIDQGADFNAILYMVRSSLGIDLGMAGVPLTPAEEVALARIYSEVIHGNAKARPDRFGNLPVDPNTGLSETDQGIVDRTPGVLSSAQISALKHSLVTTETEMKLYLEARATQGS